MLNVENIIHNRRQLHCMMEKIEAYRTNKSNILWLIDDLYALIREFKEAPKTWLRGVDDYVAAMDVVYGMANSEGRKNLNDQDVAFIAEYINIIVKMIKEYEKELPEVIEDSL
jgi:hypothetical protein